MILTTYNESKRMPMLIADIAAQTRRPDVLVVCDAGSTDETPEIIRSLASEHGLPVNVIVSPGANRSQGRNLAIANSPHEIIAATDSGARLDPDWLASLVNTIQDSGADVATGITLSGANTFWEKVGAAVTLRIHKDFVKPSFFVKFYERFIYRRRFSPENPSSRSIAFRKSAWERAGGYPEELITAEDDKFNHAMKDAGAVFALSANAITRWSPREPLSRALRYYYQSGLSDGAASQFLGVHLGRTLVYVLGLILLIAGFVCHCFWLIAGLGVCLYCGLPLYRCSLDTRNPLVIAAIPIYMLGKDIATMMGFWRVKLFKRYLTEDKARRGSSSN